MPVREFVKRDILEVVTLYWHHLGSRSGQPPAELLSAFANLYFDSPWVGKDNPSFVYQDSSGEVLGFLGIVTRRMSFLGERIGAAFAGNFVVHPKARSGVAAGRLLHAMLAGRQDVLFTDSANDTSRRLLERLGFQLIPHLNIHWSRPLRLSSYVVHTLSHKMARTSAAALRLAGKPVAAVVDSLTDSNWNPMPTQKTDLHTEELSPEMLLRCLLDFSKDQPLQPSYDKESLQWLLKFMDRNRKRGSLRKVLLRNGSHNVIGWYIYYVNPGAVGEVVQIGAAHSRSGDVIRALMHDARGRGLIALHGRAEFETLPDLSDAGCFFTCRGGWTLAHTQRSELLEVLSRGKATFSRLDGEWCLDPGA